MLSAVRLLRLTSRIRIHATLYRIPVAAISCCSLSRDALVGPRGRLVLTWWFYTACAGAKIFKTKCAQCHVAEKGGGHRQVRQS